MSFVSQYDPIGCTRPQERLQIFDCGMKWHPALLDDRRQHNELNWQLAIPRETPIRRASAGTPTVTHPNPPQLTDKSTAQFRCRATGGEESVEMRLAWLVYSCAGILHRNKYRSAIGSFGFDSQLIPAEHQLGLIREYTWKVIKLFGTYGNAALLNNVMQELTLPITWLARRLSSAILSNVARASSSLGGHEAGRDAAEEP